ncbi:transmembrane channel-like protein 7 isoform X2 [Branchiostoma floridae]|uniref:Transmembrane channel-like protein 7 isoform X1 n=1 Tax=Branchiostoma floridae TaxID=7739 RepID=A0A9J7L867_BRAFL|nr:transmembrane channel-like protein 7 isoform X1 [Branchiostoma floridae]XP_035677449.1 transmembrane channel-like protein 7 isoform X2 [Branchiostoma floridae]
MFRQVTRSPMFQSQGKSSRSAAQHNIPVAPLAAPLTSDSAIPMRALHPQPAVYSPDSKSTMNKEVQVDLLSSWTSNGTSDDTEGGGARREQRSLPRSFAWDLNRGEGTPHRRGKAAAVDIYSSETGNDDVGPHPVRDMWILDQMEDHRRPALVHNPRARMGTCRLLWHNVSTWCRHIKSKGVEIPVFLPQIKKVKARFGSGVVSVFIFIRWIFLLNLFLSAMWCCFVVIPMASVFDSASITSDFTVDSLFTAKAAMSEILIFYGNYGTSTDPYPLDLAYLLMIFLSYFGSLFLVLRAIAATSGHGLLHDSHCAFSRLLMTSWEYSLTSPEAVDNLHQTIAGSFRDLLTDTKNKEQTVNRTRKDKLKICIRRFFAWLLTLVLIGGGSAMILAPILYKEKTLDVLAAHMPASLQSFVQTFGITIVFMVVNSLVPVLVLFLPRFEHYSSRKTELYVTIGRVFVLRLTNIVVLLFSLYTEVIQSDEVSTTCPGTVIGQELYKLVLLGTLGNSLVSLLHYMVLFYWTGRRQELRVHKVVLSVTHRQALILVGTLACPVLPLLGVMSNVLSFFTLYFVVIKTCRPPVRRWRESGNSQFYMWLLAAALVVLCLPVSFLVSDGNYINLAGRKHCGPFGTEPPIGAFHRLRDEVLGGTWLQAALAVVFSGIIALPLILIMAAVISYYRVRLTRETSRGKLALTELDKERAANRHLVSRFRER